MNSCSDKTDVAASADEPQTLSKPISVSTMTIIPAMYGGCSVPIAIEGSWEDLEEQRARFFSDTQVNT